MTKPSSFDLFLNLVGALYARRRLILLGTFFPTVLAIIVVLISTSRYKSEAMINPPSQDAGFAASALKGLDEGMGGLLGSFLNSESGADQCLNILNSTRFARLMIDRYDLETAYGFKSPKKPTKYYYANVLKEFRRYATFEVTEEDALRIAMQDTSAQRAKDMVLTMIHLLDSLYMDLQKSAIRQKLAYVDERLGLAESEMRLLEDSLSSFQNKHNLLVPEAQVRLVLENAAQTEIRLEKVKEEIALEEALRGNSSAKYRDLLIQKGLLEKSLASQIRSSPDSNSFIPATSALPGIATEYFRLDRAYRIRLGVYKFLVQQAELLKLEAGKNIQVISVIDPPWVNDKRVSPKRRVIVQAVFMISLLFWIAMALLGARWQHYKGENPGVALRVQELRKGLPKFLRRA